MTSDAPPDDDHGVPMSVKIRERVKAARQRFHSNDNIAEFIRPGELELLLTHGILHLLGHDHAEPEEHELMFALQAELLQGWLAVPR